MHGAGNDFLLVNDPDGNFPLMDTGWIKSISARKTGVGCDGVILIQKSDKADLRMRFINPDGGEVEMCGNGARCIARLAYELGITSNEMTIDTVAGVVRAEVLHKDVCIHMTDPVDWMLEKSLTIDDEIITYNYINTGVPHVVIEVDNVKAVDLGEIGPKIRHHQIFSPEGTNVNFLQITGTHGMDVRTYERGVENETLACGTGMVASGLVATELKKTVPPVLIRCASGDVLEFEANITDHGATNVTLSGPARHVYRGFLEYNG